MREKELLLDNIHKALLEIKYISSVNNYEKTFMPHHINAIKKALIPVVDKFFENNMVQSKDRIWKENI